MKRCNTLLFYSGMFLSMLIAMPVVAKNNSVNVSCNIASDYQPGMQGQAFVFKRDNAKPNIVAIGGGRLFFDGQEAKLSANDKKVIADMESQMRRLVPQVRGIAVDSVDIAFSALIETAKAFSPGDKKLQETLAKARIESNKRVRDRDFFVNAGNTKQDATVIDATIAPIFADYIPSIVGNAVGDVVSMAFGDEAKAKEFEARMKTMEATLEKEVSSRAKALEPRLENFCKGMKQLDKTENTLSYQFPSGNALELFKVSEH